jgi:hypothetical protein
MQTESIILLLFLIILFILLGVFFYFYYSDYTKHEDSNTYFKNILKLLMEQNEDSVDHSKLKNQDFDFSEKTDSEKTELIDNHLNNSVLFGYNSNLDYRITNIEDNKIPDVTSNITEVTSNFNEKTDGLETDIQQTMESSYNNSYTVTGDLNLIADSTIAIDNKLNQYALLSQVDEMNFNLESNFAKFEDDKILTVSQLKICDLNSDKTDFGPNCFNLQVNSIEGNKNLIIGNSTNNGIYLKNDLFKIDNDTSTQYYPGPSVNTLSENDDEDNYLKYTMSDKPDNVVNIPKPN